MPINLDEANAFVTVHHRHHKPVPGAKFCVAAAADGRVVGVAIVGRPVARMTDNGFTLEVNRCCTDGTRNACSMLYGAAWKAAKALGYGRLITYTLPEEGGASLRGAGWHLVGLRGGGNWNVPSRPRIDTAHLLQGQKLLWQTEAYSKDSDSDSKKPNGLRPEDCNPLISLTNMAEWTGLEPATPGVTGRSQK